MGRLRYGFRNTALKFDKRAVCGINEVLSVLDAAKEEKIKTYMLIFAYQGKKYSVGFEKKKYKLGMPDGSVLEFDTKQELAQNLMNIDGKVTILREMQTGWLGGFLEVDINSNYLLEDYLVGSENELFNENMTNELNEEMRELGA